MYQSIHISGGKKGHFIFRQDTSTQNPSVHHYSGLCHCRLQLTAVSLNGCQFYLSSRQMKTDHQSVSESFSQDITKSISKSAW